MYNYTKKVNRHKMNIYVIAVTLNVLYNVLYEVRVKVGKLLHENGFIALRLLLIINRQFRDN